MLGQLSKNRVPFWVNKRGRLIYNEDPKIDHKKGNHHMDWRSLVGLPAGFRLA